MAFTCKTCGSALHSELSRTFGQCGACRDAAESIEAQRLAAERERREKPGLTKSQRNHETGGG
jgi:predicted ATP-dependent serine protease